MAEDWHHAPFRDQLARVPAGTTNPFAIALQRSQLYVELYCPEGEDRQAPHTRDECYFIVEGEGTFVCGDERVAFAPGDFLFVPAGMVHRFEDFGDRLCTWVLFFGPQGGESPQAPDPA